MDDDDDDSCSETNTLPEDIIIDILSRLPHKTLLPFKRVSKPWLSMISTSIYEKKFTKIMSGFFYNFYSSSKNDTTCVTTSFLSLPISDRKSYLYNLDFMPSSSISRVRDCCNGLVLCEAIISMEKLYQVFYVCNPATKKWVLLSLPKNSNKFAFHQMALAFDPSSSSHYHVLYFPQYGEQSNLATMKIFSSSSQTWEDNISLNWEPYRRSDKYPGVYMNGYFYLLDRRHFVIKINKKEKKISRLVPVYICKNGRLVKSGDNLLYIMLTRQFMHIQVYCENTDNFRWKYSVELPTIVKFLQLDPSTAGKDLDIVAVHMDLELVFFQVDKKLFSFHLKTHQEQELLSFTEEGSQLDIFCYSPSLSSLL